MHRGAVLSPWRVIFRPLCLSLCLCRPLLYRYRRSNGLPGLRPSGGSLPYIVVRFCLLGESFTGLCASLLSLIPDADEDPSPDSPRTSRLRQSDGYRLPVPVRKLLQPVQLLLESPEAKER